MPTTVVLEKEWEMRSSGLVKKPGTHLVFSDSSEELKEIVESGAGYPKLGLPPDLPGRTQFIKSGFDSLQKLKVLAPNWTEVKGIGDVVAEEIDEYFQNLNENEEE